MAGKNTYDKECRKIMYLSPELSLLFDAYTFHLYDTVKYRRSRSGTVIFKNFFRGMPEHEKKSLIDKYNAYRKEQNLQDDLRIKSGVEYHIIDQLYLRGGYLSNPSMFTTGIGLKIKTLQLDLSSQFHQQLGVTPGLGIRYEF